MATPCPRYAGAMHGPSVHTSSMHGPFVHDAAAEPHAKRDAGGALVAILRGLPELVPLPLSADAPTSALWPIPGLQDAPPIHLGHTGHMAPLFQPLRLLDLFGRFIHKKAI